MALYDYYKSKGKSLGRTAEERFADPAFATAAKAAGYDATNYKINEGNADANNAIEKFLRNPAAVAPVNTPVSPTTTPTAGNTADKNAVRDIAGIIGTTRRYEDADSYYNAMYGKQPSFEDTLQKEIGNVQQIIDAVNQSYVGITANAKESNANRSGQTRAIQARGGNLGGSFGKAAMDNTGKYNDQVLAQIEAEKSAKVASILQNAREFAQQRYDDERRAVEKKGDAFIEYQKETQNKFRDDMALIAKQGVSLDDIPEEDYKNLFENSGFDSQLAFESYFNDNMAKADQPDFLIDETVRGKDGKAKQRRVYIDPVTGQTVNKEYDLGFDYSEIAPDAETKVIDGALYEKQADNSWKMVAGKQGGTNTPKPKEATDKKVFGDVLKTGIAPSGEKIGNPRGPDGYVDPGVYITAFQEWGGTPNEFLSAFPIKTNVNPLSYSLLPAAIRPSTTSDRDA